MFKAALAATSDSVEGISVRFAEEDDVEIVLTFLRELAEFENLTQEMVADQETLAANLFGPTPYAECIIAENDGVAAGFALFFHSFSPYIGKPNLYLEGLYVKPEHRKSGIGTLLLREVAAIAIERDCARMEWRALDWNIQSIIFYRKLGAQPLSNWVTQRLDRAQLEALAHEPANQH